MEKAVRCALVMFLFLAGCQQPADVELQTGEDISELDLVPVVRPDSIIVTSSVDTSAVLPADQVSYFGQFVVNKVTLDAGAGNTGSFAYSRVLVSDSVVRLLLRKVGYYGIDVGGVSLNGIPMVKVAHRIAVRSLLLRDTVLTSGVEYLADVTGTYQPLAQYTWSAPSTTTVAASVSIVAPGKLTVLAPRGGNVYSRAKDLIIGWSGSGGRLQIIVSVYEPLLRRSYPILELRPRRETGKALLPASVLQQFPRGPYYVFTFILHNRKEIGIAQAPAARILVQAAEVYNSYIELR